jgi:hypothetical protein
MTHYINPRSSLTVNNAKSEAGGVPAVGRDKDHAVDEGQNLAAVAVWYCNQSRHGLDHLLDRSHRDR